MLYQIRSWINGRILHEIEADSLRRAVEILVERYADLRGADLRGADLRDADLRYADLRGADLRDADLVGADLVGADLRGADLRGADLRGADLRGANFRYAHLRGADLRGADLRGADLGGAYLIKDLCEAVELAPFLFDVWDRYGWEAVQDRLKLHPSPDDRALLVLSANLAGAYCYVLARREIWWWAWHCPNPETVPVLWRQSEA